MLGNRAYTVHCVFSHWFICFCKKAENAQRKRLRDGMFITARIQRMVKALFSRVSVCPQRGTPVPGSFPGPF